MEYLPPAHLEQHKPTRTALLIKHPSPQFPRNGPNRPADAGEGGTQRGWQVGVQRRKEKKCE